MQVFKHLIVTILIILVCASCTVATKRRDGDNYSLEIRQNVATSSAVYVYKMKNEKFYIYDWSCTNAKDSTCGVFSKSLSPKQFEKLKRFSMPLFNLDSIYPIRDGFMVIDGVEWHIKLTVGSKTKRIFLDNYTPQEVDKIFKVLNYNHIPCFRNMDIIRQKNFRYKRL